MSARELPDLSTAGDIGSILIVRLKALGDIVLSLPIVRALRDCFPRAEIRYLCRGAYAEALAGETGLDGIEILPESAARQAALALRLRRKGIDLVIDLLSSPRSALITRVIAPRIGIGMDVGRHNWCYHYVLPRAVMRNGMRLKVYTLEANREIIRLLKLGDRGTSAGSDPAGDASGAPSSEGLVIGFPAAESEREWARGCIDNLGVDRSMLVGLVPAAKYRAKSWPIPRFVELADILAEEMNLEPLVLWGPGEEECADEVAARARRAIKAPSTGIARLGALIGELRLVVGLDSGPKHLAVIQGVPTVTLFGPTDPRIWDPMNDRHRVVYHDVDCAPCRDRDCETNRCLLEITPREAADAVASLIGDLAAAGETAEGGYGRGAG